MSMPDGKLSLNIESDELRLQIYGADTPLRNTRDNACVVSPTVVHSFLLYKGAPTIYMVGLINVHFVEIQNATLRALYVMSIPI